MSQKQANMQPMAGRPAVKPKEDPLAYEKCG